MVDKVEVLVEEIATTTGTGNFTLAAKSARRTFNAGYGTGGTDVFYYFILNRAVDEYEYGTGHMLNATTLVRDTVIKSSNADTLVNFSAGTKDVVSDFPMPVDTAGKLWVSQGIGLEPKFEVITPATFATEIFTDPADFVAGTDDDITLAASPLNENQIFITFNAGWQQTPTFTLAGSVVTFDAIIPVGVTSIEVRIFDSGSIGAGFHIFSKQTITVDSVITPAGPLTLAHNLSAKPNWVIPELVNTTAEHNYAIGETTLPQLLQSNLKTDQGVHISPDATDLNIRYGAGQNPTNNVFTIFDQTTAIAVEATNASWKCRFIAIGN